MRGRKRRLESGLGRLVLCSLAALLAVVIL
jgi:hypothetical protein